MIYFTDNINNYVSMLAYALYEWIIVELVILKGINFGINRIFLPSIIIIILKQDIYFKL